MPTRTRETTVTFEHPFTLAAIDSPLPAGAYLLEIDEEEITGLSFSAYHRLGARLHIPAIGTTSLVRQALPVAPGELEAALKADGKGA